VTVEYIEIKKPKSLENVTLLQTTVDVISNKPSSQRCYDTFPPKKYPLILSITFNRRAEYLKDRLKNTLKQIPKDEVKYRQVGKWFYSFNFYFNKVNSIEPILDVVLEESEMYQRFILAPDKKVNISDMIKKSYEVLNHNRFKMS